MYLAGNKCLKQGMRLYTEVNVYIKTDYKNKDVI